MSPHDVGAVCTQSGPNAPSLIVTACAPLSSNVVRLNEVQPVSSVCDDTEPPSTPVALIGQCAMNGSFWSCTPLALKSLNLHTVTSDTGGSGKPKSPFTVDEGRILKLSVL